MSTEITENTNRLRALYDAAVHAELDSVEGRTFEQWKERVSDYGLDDARQSLEIWMQQLEHSLATGFIRLQKERNPAARQAQWVELQRLAGEIERLSE